MRWQSKKRLQTERDQARAELAALRTVIGPAVAERLQAVSADRLRLQAVVDRIVQDPAEYRHALGHVAECEANCSECRRLARDALAFGVDPGHLEEDGTSKSSI